MLSPRPSGNRSHPRKKRCSRKWETPLISRVSCGERLRQIDARAQGYRRQVQRPAQVADGLVQVLLRPRQFILVSPERVIDAAVVHVRIALLYSQQRIAELALQPPDERPENSDC